MRGRRARVASVAELALLALAQAGCISVAGPPVANPSVAAARSAPEIPTPAPAQAASHPSASPQGAVAAFAAAYINWSATTVSADMRKLAAASIGQARSAMQLAAAQTAGDYELRRGGIANRGQVEAVAPLEGRAGRYVVVTREQTTSTATSDYQGLTPAWHVTIATVVEQSPGRWALSGWQPES